MPTVVAHTLLTAAADWCLYDLVPTYGFLLRNDYIERLARAKTQPLQLSVVRKGKFLTIVISAMPACHYEIRAVDMDIINGITDGRRNGVTSGVLQIFT